VKTAIYGIGNILLGDDGVGPAVVRHLASQGLPPDVVLEDLGTPSLDLPSYLIGYDTVIFIDAVSLDAPPGTIRVFSRDEILAAPTGIRVSPHEPSINDALIVLDFAGTAPREVVLVGVVPETLEGGMALSPRVAGAVGRAGEVVVGKLADRVPALNMSRPASPDLLPARPEICVNPRGWF
jgi:hydrogenase maturation protease